MTSLIPDLTNSSLRLPEMHKKLVQHITSQGSYRQVYVKCKDFSRIFKTFLLFSRTENLRIILIYMLKFYFGNA